MKDKEDEWMVGRNLAMMQICTFIAHAVVWLTNKGSKSKKVNYVMFFFFTLYSGYVFIMKFHRLHFNFIPNLKNGLPSFSAV